MEKEFDIQGHRGCRGLMPENTIPAFLKALELGVTTLEMDVVISRDRKVVVSHDPYISSDFCLTPEGRHIHHEDQKRLLLFSMDYDRIRSFDCGSFRNQRFPHQKTQKTFKPLLEEVLLLSEEFCTNNRQNIFYNIEIKSTQGYDDIYQPEPAEFCSLVQEVINMHVPSDRICIQSFDVRALKHWKQHYPNYTLSLLVENKSTIDHNLELLGFTPDIYSPDYTLLDQRSVDRLHSDGMRVLPWTVNETKEMQKMIRYGVDGLITDYPDRYFSLK